MDRADQIAREIKYDGPEPMCRAIAAALRAYGDERIANLAGTIDVEGICCDCGVFGKKQREISGAVRGAIGISLIGEIM